MLRLYQREGCPYCKPVRQLLTDLNVTYVNVNVVKPREDRTDLIAVTGRHFIPALVDGDTVIAGTLEDPSEVLAYLRSTYGSPGEPPSQIEVPGASVTHGAPLTGPSC